MDNMRISRFNILSSFRQLKGNTRVSVLFQPLWGLPIVFFSFYLSLYMKQLGVTNEQIGYLISIRFIAGFVLSLFGGVITDRLGRKKTILITDLITWPLSLLLYLLSNSFAMLVVATVVNNFGMIGSVAWNLLVVEEASSEERVAAFNLVNIINIAAGFLVPAAGILVKAYDVIVAERIFILFFMVSSTIMIIGRNHNYREAEIGVKILEEHKRHAGRQNGLKNVLPLKAAAVFVKNPATIVIVLVYILFNVCLPLITVNSLYFAPYMTETLKLDKSAISILGGIYSAVMFFIFIFIIPVTSRRFKASVTMIAGLSIQACSLLFLTIVPPRSFAAAALCIAILSTGFGFFRPFIDVLLAEVTDERERAGIYSIYNTATCITTAVMGFISGKLFTFYPKSLYLLSVVILIICIILLMVYKKLPHAVKANNETVTPKSAGNGAVESA